MTINWGRFFVGSIIASVICFVTDGLLHEMILGGDWKAVYANLGATPPTEHPMHMAYFAVFELGRGFISMLLYVLMRPTCKPGPKTAAWAGFDGVDCFLANRSGTVYSIGVLLKRSVD